jgi:two-component system sensor histidine kinase VicK
MKAAPEVHMFFRSLQWRLVGFFCLIAIFLIIPIGFILNIQVENWYYSSFRDGIDNGFKKWDLSGVTDPTLEQIKSATIENNNNSALFLIIGSNKSFTIANRKNSAIEFSSDSMAENRDFFLAGMLQSENFVRAMAGNSGGERKLYSFEGRNYFDYARPVGNYVLYFRYYKDEWEKTIDDFNRIVLTSLFVAVIAAFILGYMLSKTITGPIVRMMHKARSIAAGDFDQVLEVKSEDEIGNLTSTFNYMAQNLKSTLSEISSEKNKIETILNYMTDGVVAFNLKGEVIHSNPAASKILGDSDIERTFNEYAAEYGLSIKLEDILYLEDLSSKEFSISRDGKTIRLYFAVFTGESKNPDGIIAVLQDITEQQRLENMRKEFVANVSHELRTPLTSIKSYPETLLDGVLEDRETAERFLGIINSEADRMTRLVRDLLQLSKLGNQQMQWKFETISFEELVKDAVEKLRIEAESKGQKLQCYSIGEIPDITADHDRIEQVVLNIVSNAIKYTPEAGSITVYIGKTHSEVYMKVADTGIGIPERDLPRIFERFYRVDKARSRQMGGTGLGLSIAKEIVEAHSGVISISSTEGRGTEVTIRLPFKQ